MCPPNSPINKEYYQQVLITLQQHIRKKRPEFCNTWILHQDNARPYTATIIADYLTAHNIEVMSHPPYTPDVAPCDYWLFPTLKRHLRGQEFKTNLELNTATNSFLKSLPVAEFEKIILKKWTERIEKCLSNRGHYFEKQPALDFKSGDDCNSE